MIGRLGSLFLAVGLCAGAAAGAITVTGDVNPTDPADWPTAGAAYVGETGVGSVRIDDDSDAVSTWGYIGAESGSTGSATVTGVGSTWLSSDGLTVAYSGNGRMDVLAGGAVESLRGWVGSHPLSTCLATIDGAGSTWTLSHYLLVGGMGDGTLAITNGGVISGAREGLIGHLADSRGLVTVEGSGSAWHSTDELTVASQGAGTLAITNGGLTSSGTHGLRIDADGDGNGVVNMGGGGMLALLGQANDSLASFLGLVIGTDAIRYWDASTRSWTSITAADPADYALSYETSGDLSGYTVLTVYPQAPAAPYGDFDRDGDVDADDIDAMVAGDGDCDVDGDGDADEDDVIFLVEAFAEWSGLTGSGVGTSRGDVNLDGLVNATDLATLAAKFGLEGGWADGNGNLDAVANATDLAILAAGFGFAAPTAAVPEPATMGLLAVGIMGMFRRRKRTGA